MLKKLLIVYVFVFSYAGAILHSIVPHHHHNSQQEAKEHHHHDQHASHSHGDDQHNDKDHEQKSSPYLFTHTANTDVLISHPSIDGVVKGKKAEKLIAVYAESLVFDPVLTKQVFHPPADDLISNSALYFSSALRAPPLSIII